MVKKEEDDEEKNAAAMTSNSKKSYTAKQTNLLYKLRKNEQTKFTEERYNNKKIEELDQENTEIETINKAEVY